MKTHRKAVFALGAGKAGRMSTTGGRAGLATILFVLCAAATAETPRTCRVQGGNLKTVWGVGLTADCEVWAWDVPYDETAVLAAVAESLAEPLPAEPLPAEPPEGAKQLQVLDRDENGRVMAVEFRADYNAEGFYDARAGGEVCWVRNADGWSPPRLVRSAQPWWVFPDRAHAGDVVRIFGRNIDAKLVVLRPADADDARRLEIVGRGRNPLYEVAVLLPHDLPVGEYELLVHNGAGGAHGWGGPLSLSVEAPPESPTLVVDARDVGARGNGVDDDTDALRAALARAGEAGGGVVVLPPGRYAITKPLWVPAGVTLQGSGSANSVLTVLDRRPMHFDVPPEIAAAMPNHFRGRQEGPNIGAMLWLRDNAAVTDLGFEDGPGVLQAIFGSHDNCRIERCDMLMRHCTEVPVMVEWGSYGFVMRDCNIVGPGGLFMVHGPHRQCHIARNTIRCVPHGTANNLFVRAFEESVIEDNVIRDGDRNWCSQTGYASAYHSILQGNTLYNAIPRRHNSGETMYESGAAEWHGRVAQATPTVVAVEGAPFEGKEYAGQFALILGGRGLGQYRRIAAHDAGSFTVDWPWDVVPDAGTYLMTGKAYVETLWIDNTEEHTANWTGFWGNCFGNVIDGHILRDGSGLFLWAWNRNTPSPVALNDIIGSRVVGRGTVNLIGPFVFGNTMRFSEVTDFRYGPNFHIQPGWVQGADPKTRAGISVGDAQHQMGDLPDGVCLKGWNVFDGNHIYDGPQGIVLADDARHTALSRNLIVVDGDPVVAGQEGNWWWTDGMWGPRR